MRSKVLTMLQLSTLALIFCSGCLWQRTETRTVRVSLAPAPECAKGVLWVATDAPLRVGVEGTGTITDKEVGGYYLLHPDDLRALMERVKKLQAENAELRASAQRSQAGQLAVAP